MERDGYQFKTGNLKDIDAHLSHNGYADDLAIFATKIRNLAKQLNKVQLYSDWADLKVNTKKCAVTGRLHGMIKHGLANHKTEQQQLERLLLHATL